MKSSFVVFSVCVVLHQISINIYESSATSFDSSTRPKLSDFSSGKWICRNEKCERSSSANQDSSMSLETCHILCPPRPPLWPKPKNIDIVNKDSSTFQKEHIFLKIHSPDEIKSIVEQAANIFLKNLVVPSDVYTLTEGEQHILKLNLHVKDSNSKPSTTTNESYTLYSQKIDDVLVVNIFAKTYFGLRHGLETLSQLIWYDVLSDRLRLFHDIQIIDEPRFNHRGLLIDVSRNYFPISVLKRSIDGMAASKLNVFHLHISDTESFPLVLPKTKYLSENGAYDPSMKYSPEDIQDLVDYARIRGIRTIIEIDAPSHVSIQAFPKNQTLCGDNDVFKTTLNPDNPETLDTLQNIYEDLFRIGTDNETFHIGDDEVLLDCWRRTEAARKSDLNQVWVKFTNSMMNRVKLANNGKIPKNIVLWSSPLTNQHLNSLNYKNNLVVQYWFGKFNHIIENGYKIIFSTVGEWYLDCGFGPWKKDQQHGSCDPYTDWKKFYTYRPWKNYLNRLNQVLGGEVCLWSEEVSSDDVETRLWPRTAAFAERVWSDPDTFNQDDAFRRIDFHSRRLKHRGFKVAAIWPYLCSLYPEKC